MDPVGSGFLQRSLEKLSGPQRRGEPPGGPSMGPVAAIVALAALGFILVMTVVVNLTYGGGGGPAATGEPASPSAPAVVRSSLEVSRS